MPTFAGSVAGLCRDINNVGRRGPAGAAMAWGGGVGSGQRRGEKGHARGSSGLGRRRRAGAASWGSSGVGRPGWRRGPEVSREPRRGSRQEPREATARGTLAAGCATLLGQKFFADTAQSLSCLETACCRSGCRLFAGDGLRSYNVYHE
jgi:hypothetical protein